MDNDECALAVLIKERDETERQLKRLNNAIAALTDGVGMQPPIDPIVDICQYLKELGKPAHQNDIIRIIGDLRQKRYPSLGNHYANVWRSLEYQIRHDRLIRCVDPQTLRVVKLKPLPPRPKGARKLDGTVALYEQENWFALKEEVAEGRYASREERTSEIAGLD